MFVSLSSPISANLFDTSYLFDMCRNAKSNVLRAAKASACAPAIAGAAGQNDCQS